MPRLRSKSPKRRAPKKASRTIRSVHQSPNTSSAWPMPQFMSREALPPHDSQSTRDCGCVKKPNRVCSGAMERAGLRRDGGRAGHRRGARAALRGGRLPRRAARARRGAAREARGRAAGRDRVPGRRRRSRRAARALARVRAELGAPSVLLHNAVAGGFGTFETREARGARAALPRERHLAARARAGARARDDRGGLGRDRRHRQHLGVARQGRLRGLRADQGRAADPRRVARARARAEGRARRLRRDRRGDRRAVDAPGVRRPPRRVLHPARAASPTPCTTSCTRSARPGPSSSTSARSERAGSEHRAPRGDP